MNVVQGCVHEAPNRQGAFMGGVVGVAIFGRGWGPTVWAESLLTYLAPVVLASGTPRPQSSALP